MSPPQPFSWEMLCIPKMLLSHRVPGPWPSPPVIWEGLKLGWTPLSMSAPGSPLPSCAHPVHNGVCFCLPSWKIPSAPPLRWRCSGLRPFPAAHWSYECFGRSSAHTLHLGVASEGGCWAWAGSGANWQHLPPSPWPLLAGFHPVLLLCCPQ